jgi:hypothetical protein
MTEPTPQPPPKRKLPSWVLWVIALVIGFVIGWGAKTMSLSGGGGGPTGNCVRADTSIAQRNVTQGQCQQICPNCTWEQY